MLKSLWSDAIVLIGVLGCTKAATLDFFSKESFDTPIVSAPLENPEAIYFEGISKYENYLNLVFAHGFGGDPFGQTSNMFRYATLSIKDKNVSYIALGYKKEASGGILGVAGLPDAFTQAKKVAELLAAAIQKLVRLGAKLSSFILVGFSLGAHVMGYTGTLLKNALLEISRILGLDPATNPNLLGKDLFIPSLSSECAKFVLAIHTCSGTYGTTAVSGHADVHYNPQDKPNQPGCPPRTLLLFSKQDSCCHNRAVDYFAEAIQSERNPCRFLAMGADNEKAWIDGKPNNHIICLGLCTDMSARGNYYIRSNPESPFGMGEDGTRPAPTTTSPLNILGGLG